jgi:O-succinylbenzoic acid--CoA ligase
MGEDLIMLLDFESDSIEEVIIKLKKSSNAAKEYISSSIRFLMDWNSAKPLFKVMSSGTTGKAKELEFDRSSLEQSALISINTFTLKPGDILFHALPLSFIAGKMMLVRAIIGKMKLYIVEPSANPLENLSTQIDFAAFTPHQLQSIISNSPEKLNLITTIIIGGSKLDLLLEKKLQAFDCKVYETFGMSETLTHFAVRKLKKTSENLSFEVLDGFDWGINEESCLWVSAAHLPHSPIQTNDLIEVIDKLHFIWLGRKDNVINSGGIKVYPETIERKFLPFISVPFIITKQKDEQLGEKVVLLIEEKNRGSIDFQKLDFSMLTKYERPREIKYINRFPLNKNGKINRSLLNG